MKYLLKFLLFIFLLISIFYLRATNSYAESGKAEAINPPASTIDERTWKVKITFSNLISGREYHLCLNTDGCAEGIIDFEESFTANSPTVTYTVCADGNNKVKPETECNDNDYFHLETYKVHLFGSDKSTIITTAAFDVGRYVPQINVTPTSNITPLTQLTVTIEGTRRPHNEPNRNNYQIDVEGENGSSKPNGIEQCFPVTPTTPVSYMIGPFNVGDYRIEVTEQVDEDSFCEDNTVYYKISHFTVRNDGGEITGEETLGEDGTSVTGPPGRNPCEDGTCPAALGNISTDIASFSTQFLSIAIGIAGGIALVLMVIGSIRVLMSSGDPKGVGAGRDMIIAAVAGLLFLIFSVLILKFIGLNILRGII